MKSTAIVLIVCALSLTLTTPAIAQAPSDDDIVRSMTPQSLKSELLEQRRDPADIKYSYVRWPTTGGTPQILAAYNSDQSMEVVLIQLSDPPAVIDTSDFPYGGYGTEMTLRDIDNDGALEAVWEVDTIQGSETNLLTVQDGKIYYLNAPGDLMESTWVDFDGDGVLEAISRGHSMGDLSDGSEDPVWISPVYRFRDGTLVHEGDVFNFSSFSVGRQPPREQVETVFLGRLDVPYRIRVLVNDPNDTLQQSRAADIVWNGVTVMTAEAFAQKTPPFTVNVVPKRENTLEFRNITPDHSGISVVVEAAAPIVPLKVSPVVECVWDEGGGRFTASFGYNNPNPSETRIDAGPTNKFTPAPIDRGQRKAFLPGRHRHEFWVQSNGEKLVWTLNGKTATASLSHPTRCQGSPPAQR